MSKFLLIKFMQYQNSVQFSFAYLNHTSSLRHWHIRNLSEYIQNSLDCLFISIKCNQTMPPRKTSNRLKQSDYQKIAVIEPEYALLSNKTQAKKLKNKDSQLETNIIIATILLICLGLVLYFAVMLNLSSSAKSDIQPILLSAQNNLRNRKYVEFEQKSAQKQGIIADKWVLEWIEKFKKLSTQITMLKLERAKQFLQNFTSPINAQLYRQQFQAYQRDYQIQSYAEKPMCIVVPTFNNIENDRYKHNILSILQQEYQNYRVIVIDDNSNDHTAEHIEQLIRDNPAYIDGRVKIQRNLQRKMALRNILDAAQGFCKPKDIMMVIDGDDFLLGKHVFKLFNAAFSSTNSWVVYSNFLSMDGKVGFSRRYPTEITQQKQFRRTLFIISHLRACYTQLILNIKPQDFLDQSGNMFHAANDVAIFMPVLQMASKHILYLPQINYYYNSETGHNNHLQKKKQQIRNDQFIRNKPKYKTLEYLFTEEQNHQ